MKGLRYTFNLENIQIFIFAYAGLKWKLKAQKTSSTFTNSLVIVARLLLTVLISILTYTILLIFAIYYELVNALLRFKHGKDYLGILEGTDVIWTVEDQSRSIINSLFLLEVKGHEDHRDVLKFFTESYGDLCRTHPKLGCLKKQYMGYYYFLKTHIDTTHFVRYMEDYADENGLKFLLDKYSNSAFPMGDCALWEIHVGRTPINWKKCKEKKLYPVLIKYHHCVGDGITIVAMMTTNLLQDGVDIMKAKCETYKALLNKNKSRTKARSIVQKLKAACKSVCTKDFYIKYSGPLTPKDTNMLHGQALTGEKHLCWALEDANDKYVNKVKDIKNRFVGISFSDVLLTAVSASFAEYYMKHDQEPPETVRSAITLFFSSPEFKKIITYKDGHPVSRLNNKFSIGVVDIPIKDAKLKGNLISRLLAVKKDAELLKKSLDFPFIYWQLKVVSTLVPIPLLMLSVKSNDNTLVVTNVPGNKTATLLSGHVIRDTIIWAPNYLATGISFSIFTYDDLFRFGLMVDKAIMDSREEVQNILDNVFKYIDHLEELTRNF